MNPSVFLRAAEILSAGDADCCCGAIRRAAGFSGITEAKEKSPEMRYFKDLFENDADIYNGNNCVYYWEDGENSPREIALLLAHEIAKDEARKGKRK